MDTTLNSLQGRTVPWYRKGVMWCLFGMCQVRWINAMLVWMWQRSPAAGPATLRPDIVESWLRAMTDEADKQAVSSSQTCDNELPSSNCCQRRRGLRK